MCVLYNATVTVCEQQFSTQTHLPYARLTDDPCVLDYQSVEMTQMEKLAELQLRFARAQDNSRS